MEKNKKVVCKCGGYVIRSDAGKEYIQLQGDHVDIVKNYLCQKQSVDKENIIYYG